MYLFSNYDLFGKGLWLSCILAHFRCMCALLQPYVCNSLFESACFDIKTLANAFPNALWCWTCVINILLRVEVPVIVGIRLDLKGKNEAVLGLHWNIHVKLTGINMDKMLRFVFFLEFFHKSDAVHAINKIHYDYRNTNGKVLNRPGGGGDYNEKLFPIMSLFTPVVW